MHMMRGLAYAMLYEVIVPIWEIRLLFKEVQRRVRLDVKRLCSELKSQLNRPLL